MAGPRLALFFSDSMSQPRGSSTAISDRTRNPPEKLVPKLVILSQGPVALKFYSDWVI